MGIGLHAIRDIPTRPETFGHIIDGSPRDIGVISNPGGPDKDDRISQAKEPDDDPLLNPSAGLIHTSFCFFRPGHYHYLSC
jgi:hypothetical protein